MSAIGVIMEIDMKNKTIWLVTGCSVFALLVLGLARFGATIVTAQDTNPPPSAPGGEITTNAPAEPGQTEKATSDEAKEAAPTTEFLSLPEEPETLPEVQVKTTETAQNLISITLDDVEMLDVVRMFTRISGANIIATPSNLLGKVTVNLTDVEWQPALVSILYMHNLQLTETTPGSGVYSILPKQPGAPEPLIVETLFLKYASVSNVESVVKSMLTQGGTVSAFPSRNALVVRTTSANLGEIKQIILNIDKLREQVFIEAKFMELNDDAIKDLGINWQALENFGIGAGNIAWDLKETRNWSDSRTDKHSRWDKRNRTDRLDQRFDVHGEQYEEATTTYEEAPPDSDNWVARTVVTPTRTISDGIDLGKNVTSDVEDTFKKVITDARTAVLGAEDFRLILSALKQMDGVSVISNPKIVVANEEPAIIHIGQTERPFVSSITPGQQGIAPIVTYNPGSPVDFGVKLTVTPTVNTASNITVKIEPELTRFLRDAVAPNGQTYPIIAKKNIRTVFCLESGKTVGIGGLTETNDRDVTKKIPLLGDIPLIGKYLFSYSHMEKGQQETIIFVTVGLASPETIERKTGLPEDSELTQRHLIKSQVQKRRLQEELEKLNEASELEGLGKKGSRLLRRRE